MRGRVEAQSSMFALLSPESLVPAEHPLRRVKALADQALRSMNDELDALYAADGRPSVPPETLVRATLIIALYSVRSERQFCEQLRYNMLFRWFLDMDMVADVFDASTFSKNRQRLIGGEVAQKLLTAIVEIARGEGLLSSEHFSVDGTLLEAWASMKSVRPIGEEAECATGRNPTVDFRGEQRKNDTHASTTDPEAKLARKSNGTTTKLCFTGHALTENRSGLVLACSVGPSAGGATERDVALQLLAAIALGRNATVGGDRGYNTRAFVKGCRTLGVTPHVAMKAKYSAIDGRTTRHARYAVSQRARKRIEEVFGWGKTVGGLRKLRVRGIERSNHVFATTLVAYNLIRMSKLLGPPKGGSA